MRRLLENYWYQPKLNWLTALLLPFSWFFYLITRIRFYLYRWGVKKVYRARVPVVVVGNLTVGGTGKTPFVIWLANYLREQGWRPGIVSRGVGGKPHSLPRWVYVQDVVADVGDEAILLVRRTSCPMVICIDRPAAVKALLASTTCNVVISDDGLQHYALGRNVEIALIDGERQLGNQYLLPAGPLRESVSRLKSVDLVVTQGTQGCYTMGLEPLRLINVAREQDQVNIEDFPNKQVHAVAAIGHPERFFASLRHLGFSIIEHAFPDHYLYQAKDFAFSDGLSIIMTEKDAVKCLGFADLRFWYLSVEAVVSAELKPILTKKILSSS